MKLTTHIDDFVFEIENFLSDTECDEWIKWSEDHGYEDALIIAEDGAVRNEEIRNNDRIISDDEAYAQSLWDRLKPLIPDEYRGGKPVGLNERFRFYRYDIGQKFDWHKDGCFERENGERSLLTFMIYLNDGFEGGTTSFSSFNTPWMFSDFVLKPKKGSAALFFHPVSHRGDEVEKGMKYVIRTDVMFRKGE